VDPENGPLNYGLATPILTVNGAISACPSVQATKTKNGEFHIQILKSSVDYRLQ